MKTIDSLALEPINRALGLAGGGAQVQLLDDGVVSLVLDVGRVAAQRELVPQTGNVYLASFRNVHAGAGALTASIDPFAPGAFGQNGFPGVVPLGWDIWLLAAYAVTSSSANFSSAVLDYLSSGTGSYSGFGKTDGGLSFQLVSPGLPLAVWTTTVVATGLNTYCTPIASNVTNVLQRIRLKLLRGQTLRFRSNAVVGAVTTDCACLLTVVPTGLSPVAL